MPNWCMTDYIFHGSRRDLDALEEFLDNVADHYLDESRGESSVFYRWLGNLMRFIHERDGMSAEEAKDEVLHSSIACRGEITYIDRRDANSLLVTTETAWCPMHDVWDFVIGHLNGEVFYSYYAEEPGCELYYSYDSTGDDFPEDYVFDYYLGRDESDVVARALPEEPRTYTEEALRGLLAEWLYGYKDARVDIEQLIEEAENYPFTDESSWISIHEIDKE